MASILSKRALGVVAVCVLAAGAWFLNARTGGDPADTVSQTTPTAGSQIVEVVLPELSQAERIGQMAFTAKCAACHGATAGGVLGSGPPLIHKIYEPSHHADEAFYRAATLGVQSHHWPFGNMPPVEGITRADVTGIIAFIRKVQRANGIE